MALMATDLPDPVVPATSTWGILFPLFIGILVPVRFGLGHLFDSQHLDLLDAEDFEGARGIASHDGLFQK